MPSRFTRRQFLAASVAAGAVTGVAAPAGAQSVPGATMIAEARDLPEAYGGPDTRSRAATYGAAPFETPHLIPGDKLDLKRVDRSAPNAQVVALTFDDGPDPLDRQTMRLLAANNANATFFVIGRKVTQHPEMTAELATGGFEVGCHSFSHPMMGTLNGDQRNREFSSSLRAFAPLGIKPAWFRPPYGDWNQDIARRAASFGMKTVTWTVDSRDWKLSHADDIIARVVHNLSAGAVVLMHGTKPATLEALPTILAEGRLRNLTFVTMSEWYRRMAAVAGV